MLTIWAKIAAVLSTPLLLILSFFKRAKIYRGSLPQTHKWYKKKLPGCVSSDGSPYYTYYKKGTVNKTVVYFGGGGASWNEYTAANPTTLTRLFQDRECYYFPYVRNYMELGMTGLVAANSAHNPLNGYNAIYLPYATGDFHIGQNDFPYRKGGRVRMLYHRGLANVRAALKAAPKDFFNAQTVFIGGESAGAFAAVAWASELVPLFPICERFILLADGGQMWYPHWKEILRDIWKSELRHTDCLRSDGQLIRDWLLHLNDIFGDRLTYLYSISPFDEVLSQYENKLSGGTFEATREAVEKFHLHLKEAVDEMLHSIPTFRAFVYCHGLKEKTGATAHTITRMPLNLYSDKTDALSVSEWLDLALAGEDIPNVGLDKLEL